MYRMKCVVDGDREKANCNSDNKTEPVVVDTFGHPLLKNLSKDMFVTAHNCTNTDENSMKPPAKRQRETTVEAVPTDRNLPKDSVTIEAVSLKHFGSREMLRSMLNDTKSFKPEVKVPRQPPPPMWAEASATQANNHRNSKGKISSRDITNNNIQRKSKQRSEEHKQNSLKLNANTQHFGIPNIFHNHDISIHAVPKGHTSSWTGQYINQAKDIVTIEPIDCKENPYQTTGRFTGFIPPRTHANQQAASTPRYCNTQPPTTARNNFRQETHAPKRGKMATAKQPLGKVVNTYTENQIEAALQQASYIVSNVLPVRSVNCSIPILPDAKDPTFLSLVGLEAVVNRMRGHDMHSKRHRRPIVICGTCGTDVTRSWHSSKEGGDEVVFRCEKCQDDYLANNTLKERVAFLKDFITETLSQMDPAVDAKCHEATKVQAVEMKQMELAKRSQNSPITELEEFCVKKWQQNLVKAGDNNAKPPQQSPQTNKH